MKLINNDCIEAMKAMPDNFIDAIVTDPPYELGFMGKSWDSTGIAFNVEVWQEALRVLKPGGHLIAFSGSRTYHRMAVAIEDAGFEIRDQIMWVYGSGFPKSLNIAKALDKSEGLLQHEGKNMRNVAADTTALTPTIKASEYVPPAPKGDAAKQWQGWGTALKPAHEPMVLARKPLIGTVAANVLEWGVGGLNIDETRVGTGGGTKLSVENNDKDLYAPGTAKLTRGYGEPVEGLGRWPANFIHDGSDEVVALFPDTASGKPSGKKNMGNGYHGNFGSIEVTGFGDSGSAARFFYCAKTSKRDRNEGLDGSYAKQMDESRKAGSKRGNNPRNRGANERVNHHPTVKPTSLMQYLVRLVTPAGGTVLDPFMGSGSTGKACAYEGFNFIGIDQSAEYVEIARARIDFALAHKEEMLDLDGE